MRIAYLGPAGSWTHQAAIDLFGEAGLVPLAYDALFAAYADGTVDRACIPVTAGRGVSGTVESATGVAFASSLTMKTLFCSMERTCANSCAAANVGSFPTSTRHIGTRFS